MLLINNYQIKWSFLLILIFSFITFISCENKEASNELSEKEKSSDELAEKNKIDASVFEETAKIHNEAMEYIFTNLNNSKKDISKSSLKKGKNLIKKFIEKNEKIGDSITKIADSLAIEEFNKVIEYKEKESNTTSSDYLSQTISKNNKYLSGKQKNLLYKIHYIVNFNNSVDTIINKLENIKNEECLKLPKEERRVIYAATNVGIKSVLYWEKHCDKWSNLNFKHSDKSKIDWESIAESDIAGAVAGAISGAIGGGVGAGPGAVGGAIGGCIGSSAADAIFQAL